MHRHLLRPWLNGLRLLRRPNLHREESTISSFTKPVQQPAENVPRRAVLYVPGNDERKIAKIDRLSKLDCVVLDMEDGVADSKKSEARDLIFKTLSNANFVMQRLQLGQDIAVRINSPLIDEKHSEDDLKAALEGDTIPRSLFVPKVENREMVDWLAAKISAILYDRQDLQEPLRIVLYVESAEGLINMVKILKQATFLGGMMGLESVGTGSGFDFFHRIYIYPFFSLIRKTVSLRRSGLRFRRLHSRYRSYSHGGCCRMSVCAAKIRNNVQGFPPSSDRPSLDKLQGSGRVNAAV